MFYPYGIVAFLCLLFSSPSAAQKLTYYKDIQAIIYRHCISCHRPGEAGPFSLLGYEDLARRADFVRDVTAARYMPPWFADASFRRFHNQRGLSDAEIALIAQWVADGKKEGKKKQGLDPETYLRDTLLLPQPDLVFEMSKAFEIPGDNKEQFRIFVLPTRLPNDVYVRGVQFLPGNRQLAHHARVMVDTTNLLRNDDGIAVGASSEFEQTGVKLYDNFWYGWVPGNTPVFYPEGLAKRLPRNADLVLNMHYSPSPVAATDRSQIRLFLAKKSPKKPVKTLILAETEISNPPFLIYANTKTRFYLRSPVVPIDLKLLSVLPHAHKLGRSFKAYAITPRGEVLPIIHIPKWNFNWQSTYQFADGGLGIPKGSVIYAEAEYDNTDDNPANPNFPPKDVGYGWGSAQEMMNLIFEYVENQP